MEDDELRRFVELSADAHGETMCANRVTLLDVAHYAPELDRCQIVLNAAPGDLPPPWEGRVYGTNIAAIARCSRCRTDRPNAWLKDVPFDMVKGYIAGVVGDSNEAVTINWEPLRRAARVTHGRD